MVERSHLSWVLICILFASFKDIDPEDMHQEYIDKFCRIDFDVKNHIAFVYPKYEDWPAKD